VGKTENDSKCAIVSPSQTKLVEKQLEISSSLFADSLNFLSERIEELSTRAASGLCFRMQIRMPPLAAPAKVGGKKEKSKSFFFHPEKFL
jgi:hypothetical protein